MKVILIPPLEWFLGNDNVHYVALFSEYELNVAG